MAAQPPPPFCWRPRSPPATPRSGELLLCLAEALRAMDETPSLASERTAAPAVAAPAALAAPPGTTATAEVAPTFADAVTAAVAAAAEMAAVDGDSPAVGDGNVVVVDGAEGEEGQRRGVSPMEDLVLEPPALAAAAAGRAEEAAAAMAAMATGEVERGASRKRGADGDLVEEEVAVEAAARVAADSAHAKKEQQQQLDHVLEALVRARGIVLPRSRWVSVRLRDLYVLSIPLMARSFGSVERVR